MPSIFDFAARGAFAPTKEILLFFTFVACLQYLIFLAHKTAIQCELVVLGCYFGMDRRLMELQKKTTAHPFYLGIVMSILRINYPTVYRFCLCGCGKKKGKRRLPLMPVDSGILRSTAFFRYTTRYHMFDSCNMGLFFFCPNEKFTKQILFQQTKKFLHDQFRIRDTTCNARLDPLLG